MNKGNSHKSNDFTIRDYHNGDEYKLNEMFNEVFFQKRDISHWYWKYRDHPYGSHFISLAISSSGEFAAHYGGYPVKLYFLKPQNPAPEEFPVFHLGDKMTRRQFRSAGFGKSSLLTRTFMHFQDTFVKDEIPFGYGFATHHSLRFGLLFLNYADIEPVPYRKLGLEILNSMKVNRFKLFLSVSRVKEASEIDDKWTEFFYNVAPHYTCLFKRDAVYLRWRYLKRPDRKYLILLVKKSLKITGWSVFYREGNKVIWGDALFNPGDSDSVKSMFYYLRSHPVTAGADFVECWFPKRPGWWDNILQQLGFNTSPEPNNLHFTGPVFNDPNAPGMLRKYCYYTLGDSDLF